MDEDLKYPRIKSKIFEVGLEYTVTVWHRKGPTQEEATLMTDEVVKSVDEGLNVTAKYAAQLDILEKDVDVEFSLPSLRRAERTEQLKSVIQGKKN